MSKLLTAIATVLVCVPALAAAAGSAPELRSLSSGLWNAPKHSSSLSSVLKNEKNDMAIVYGGEDVSRKLSTDSHTV